MRLHVGGLAPDVRTDEVAARFAPFGRVQGVELVTKYQTHSFAYVDLEATDEQLEKCVKAYAHSKWRGRQLSVAPAKPDYLEWEASRSAIWAEWEASHPATSGVGHNPEPAPVPLAAEIEELYVRRGRGAPFVVARPRVTNMHVRSFEMAAALAKADPPGAAQGRAVERWDANNNEDADVSVGSSSALDSDDELEEGKESRWINDGGDYTDEVEDDEEAVELMAEEEGDDDDDDDDDDDEE